MTRSAWPPSASADRAAYHTQVFSKIPGVRYVAVCDPDQNHVNASVKFFADKGLKVDGYTDLRKLLERKDIDAITSATPNHWHALVTVWACQAGKDVYIEKPACHEIWEGRKMVEAARKYNRIVQIGTQKRSSEAHKAAFEWIRAGNIGKIKWVRGFCYKPRGPSRSEAATAGLWRGPTDRFLSRPTWTTTSGAARRTWSPCGARRCTTSWHWLWNTGCGDIGNQGPHEMDIARWALGDPGLAPQAFSIGGRFGVSQIGDVGETPNTQIAYFDYKPAPLIFEVRGLPARKGERRMDNYRRTGVGVGNCVQCEGGYFPCGDGGGSIFDNDGKKIKSFTGKEYAGVGGEGHHENFIKAVRSRQRSDLNADIEVGTSLGRPVPHGQHLLPAGQEDEARRDQGRPGGQPGNAGFLQPDAREPGRQRGGPGERADHDGPDADHGPREGTLCRRVQRHGQHVPEAQLPRAVRGAGKRVKNG